MLKKLWRKYVTKPTRFQGSKLPMKYAFTCDGVDYFEPDPDSGGVTILPWYRALTLHQYYEELRMKVDRDYLERHTKAVDLAIRGTKEKPKRKFDFDDLQHLTKLNNMLSERLAFIFTPDLVYKVASVVFMTENESPEKYEEGINKKKIESWKKNGLDTFFLKEPVQRLIPFLNFSPHDIRNYGELVEGMESEMNNYLNTYLSGQGVE